MNKYSEIPVEKSRLYAKELPEPVHTKERVNNTKWVVLRYPTTHMAIMAKMSTEAFEEYYFNVTSDVNYQKMSDAMDEAAEFMAKADNGNRNTLPGMWHAFRLLNTAAGRFTWTASSSARTEFSLTRHSLVLILKI